MTGYVAHRLRDKFPALGFRTDEAGKDSVVNVWIAANSKGGLRQPNKNLIEATKAAEEVFLEVHGREGFSKAKKILSTTVDKILRSKPECKKVPEEAIQLYVRTRTYIRIRTFNQQQASDISFLGFFFFRG